MRKLSSDTTYDVSWIGAYDIDPKISLFCDRCARQTGNAIACVAKQQLSEQVMQVLVTVDWPEAARPHIEFEIESEETVKRESGGSWWGSLQIITGLVPAAAYHLELLKFR